MANLRALVKDWAQSASPTSGITAYGNTGKAKKVRLRARKQMSLGLLRKAFNPDQPRDEKGRWASAGGGGDDSSSSSGSGAAASSGTSVPTGQHLSALNPDHLARLDAANAEKLTAIYQAAAAAKPEFDKQLQAIANDLSGQALLPPLKGSDRATEKVRDEYGGKAEGLRDVLRATLEVKTVDAAQSALAQLREKFDVMPTGFRNTLTPDAKTLDGYRDIKMNVQLNGLAAEIQINVPAMLSAKNEMHVLYEQRRSLAGKLVAENRQPTSEEAKTIDNLDSSMRAGYDAAWEKILKS